MSIGVTINGKLFTVNLNEHPADLTLNTFIRDVVGLHGTKFMCLEGGCGACICVVKSHDPASGKAKIWATNSCLTLLNTCNGWEIITIEGIGNKKDGYHPIQTTLAKLNGTQCGYCSPGIVMNMFGLLQSKKGKVTMEEVENSFGGNLCRCTGYRPVLDAMKSFAADYSGETVHCPDIEDLIARCPKTGQNCNGNCKTSISFQMYSDGTQWFWPNNLEDLFDAFNKIGTLKYMLVAGNTAHGVYRRPTDIKVFIDIKNIIDLHTYKIGNDLTLGGNISLSECMEIFLEAASKSGFEYCTQLYNHFDLIANVPIRNTGTLGGNLMMKHQNKDFPSDVFITFEALNAKIVVLENIKVTKTLSLLEFLSLDMTHKVILAFVLPAYPKSKYLFNSYKIMPRAQNAHAYVNAGFLINIDQTSKIVKMANICFGGINPEFIHAENLEKFLVGKSLFDGDATQKSFDELNKEVKPNWVLPDASPEYRKTLACGLFYKFLLSVAPNEVVKSEFKSGGDILRRSLSSGYQRFDTHKEHFPVNEPVTKVEGLHQCSGEATYMNDVPTLPNQVWCAFVNATKVNSEIVEIDASEALKLDGVIAFYSAKDIPGKNSFIDLKQFLFFDEEEIFCSGRVKYYNQPLGVIVAENSALANIAAMKVKVMYTTPNGSILTSIKEVLESKETHRIIERAVSSVKEWQPADGKTVAGYFDIGGQYHFTMEPQTTVCIPKEDGFQIYSATQWMDMTQIVIARALNIKVSSVRLEVRRLGGGYGGKITRGNQVACACSLVSKLLNRPARFVQTIESMMGSLGKRYACHSDYEVQVDKNGKIKSLRNTFYEDAGYSQNECPVPGHSDGTARNCYEKTDTWKIDGKAVLTDAPSHTWCRAPGTVEGIAMMENIIEHISSDTGLDPVHVRLANIPSDSKMKTLLPDFLKKIEHEKRKQEIVSYNTANRWKKKGLGISVMEYPVGYFGMYPATVSIYHGDGTVAISHGGIEMGQGLNTKVAQVAAKVLGISLEMITIEPSDSFSGANSMVTGGAVGSESLCFAVQKACNILLERLKPLRKSNKVLKWQDLIQEAYEKKINLIANDVMRDSDMKSYIVWGMSCTEVEIDILTGNLIIKRVDILEDTGESLSPNIDIGQIEGAFVMGMGYWLTEDLIFDRSNGELLTNRTWNYKIPGVKDIPVDFRIDLLQNSSNSNGFMRSKATGEPAVCLSISVVFAVRNAVESARADAGLPKEWLHFGAPTTPELILQQSGATSQMFKLI